MVKRNPHVAKLHAGYLFPEIVKRKQTFLQRHPDARIISLGIGDTTEPLPSYIVDGLTKKTEALGTPEGYSGYGPEEGELPLRQLIAKEIYRGQFDAEELFISDGTNSDIGRLQVLFGSQVMIAVQDPTYPAYVDVSVMMGQTAEYDPLGRKYGSISYMPCLPERQFFPRLAQAAPSDLIYFCSPNNPTGAVATHSQLTELVAFAKERRAIIIYDTAYSHYIQDPSLPRSIYEIPGAEEAAIELGSFSKMAGFSGVRLAWSVVPNALRFEGGRSVREDWSRVHATLFNGASNISQAGGLAVLHPEGQKGIRQVIDFYMANAAILRSTFEEAGYEVHGGDNAPYLWVRFPTLSSWEAFDLLLERVHILSAPGSGFGPSGEGFLRLSAFGSRKNIEEAAERLKRTFRLLRNCS